MECSVLPFQRLESRGPTKRHFAVGIHTHKGEEGIGQIHTDERMARNQGIMLHFCPPCWNSEWTSTRNGFPTRSRVLSRRSHDWRLTGELYPQTTRRAALRSLATVPLFLIPKSSHARIEGPELRGLDEATSDQPPFRDIGGGIKAQEVSPGSGDSRVEDGSVVGVKYVMRRSNGYFIDASYGFDRFETFNFRAGSGQVVPGFDLAMHGMRVGGRRRFIVPPRLGYVKGTGKNDPGPIPPDFGARRSLASHAKEPLIFEVQVVKIR